MRKRVSTVHCFPEAACSYISILDLYCFVYIILSYYLTILNTISVNFILFPLAEPLVQVDGKPSCCFFKFSPKLMFTKVLKAQLWVYLRPLQQTSTVYLQILRLKPITEQGSRHIRIRSLKIELSSQAGHWQSIDFKHVLQNWFKQPHTNWGIDINAYDESGNDLAVTSLRPGEEGLVRTLRPVRPNILL